MSLTSYRAAPPRDEVADRDVRDEGGSEHILLVDLAATYSPAP
jgi:hypothetical protein